MHRQPPVGSRQPLVKDELLLECPLCHPTDLEIRQILKSCVRLMVEFSGGRFRDRKLSGYSGESDKYRGSLEKLLRFLFFDQFSEGETFGSCQHQALYGYSHSLCSYYKAKTGF